MSHKPSAIDAIANEYTAKVIELSPMTGSSTGLGERHDVLDDFSPQGLDAYTQLDRETLAKLDEVTPTDAVDEVTVAAMRERLGLSIELAEAGEPLRNLNNIASTSQDIRDLFDLLPTESEQDWANICARLGDVKRALGGHVESLRLAASRGQVAAARQVRAVAGQAHNQAGESSSFLALVSSPETQALPESLRKELAANAASAQAAYGDFANFLETELLPQAGEQDGVGRERYQLFSREFLGATIDLDETYEWGRERLAAIDAEQRELARELYGEGVSVQEALKRLDEEPRYQQHGTDALKKWMQETADAAVAGLNGTHLITPRGSTVRPTVFCARTQAWLSGPLARTGISLVVSPVRISTPQPVARAAPRNTSSTRATRSRSVAESRERTITLISARSGTTLGTSPPSVTTACIRSEGSMC